MAVPPGCGTAKTQPPGTGSNGDEELARASHSYIPSGSARADELLPISERRSLACAHNSQSKKAFCFTGFHPPSAKHEYYVTKGYLGEGMDYLTPEDQVSMTKIWFWTEAFRTA